MDAVLALVYQLLDLYKVLIFVYIIFSWLVAFSVLNTRNRFVALVLDFLGRLIEPLIGRIRRIIPSLGGVDLSPVILILIVMFIQRIMRDSFGYQITYL